MLKEAWSIYKASFRSRMIFAEAVVVSFSIFASFPNLVVKLLALVAFAAAGGPFVANFAFVFFPQLWLTITHRQAYKIPMSDEIRDLSKQIGVTIKAIRLKGPGFHNAYVMAGNLVLGIGLLNDLDFEERQAVVAHELGHVKERHGLVKLLLMLPMLAFPLYSWQTIYSPTFVSEQFTQVLIVAMMNIAMLAYIVIVMIPINWYLEVRADRIAAKSTSKKAIRAALLALSSRNKSNPQEPSEDHPSVMERVRSIKKLADTK